jgi:hypothetical protein
MALTPQQLQALFQSISAGSQGAFSGATPGMNQDERNQWINSYGTGGTNYGDYLNWYGNQHGGTGSGAGGAPLMASLDRPSGVSYTPGGNFSGGAGSYSAGGAGSYSAGSTPPPGAVPPPAAPPPGGEVRSKAGGAGTGVWNPTPENFGWHQYYSPGSGASGPGNPYAMGPSGPYAGAPGGGGGGAPPPGITPPGGGGAPGARPKSGGYSFVAGGGSNPSPWGNTRWQ